MKITYYIDENNTIFAHNEQYDILRIYLKKEHEWRSVNYTFMELNHDHNLTMLSKESIKLLIKVSPEPSFERIIKIIKNNTK